MRLRLHKRGDGLLRRRSLEKENLFSQHQFTSNATQGRGGWKMSRIFFLSHQTGRWRRSGKQGGNGLRQMLVERWERMRHRWQRFIILPANTIVFVERRWRPGGIDPPACLDRFTPAMAAAAATLRDLQLRRACPQPHPFHINLRQPSQSLSIRFMGLMCFPETELNKKERIAVTLKKGWMMTKYRVRKGWFSKHVCVETLYRYIS